MQNGAGEAYWAHNPEVRGSKPRSATFILIYQSFRLRKIFFARHKTIVLLKQNVSVDPSLMARLRKHKQILRQLRLRQHSVKKRRQMLMDAKGNQLFRDLHDLVCVCLS